MSSSLSPSVTSASSDPLQCDYFDAGACHSCTVIGVPYAQQLADKERRARRLLRPFLLSVRENPDSEPEGDPTAYDNEAPEWLPTVASQPVRFRNKAKLVVGGTHSRPTLGILDSRRHGVDLSHCALVDRRIEDVLTAVSGLVIAAKIPPYNIPARRGELKNVILTVSPEGELMVRFVLRSTSHLTALREGLPALLQAAPQIRVVSANIHPEHKAVLEGDHEIVLTERATLPMRLKLRTDAGDGVSTDRAAGADTTPLTLTLGVQSFFQTNTAVAEAMYSQAAKWAQRLRPRTAWDLYSGVGGFALAVAGAAREVVGVEVSEEAVQAAQATADALAVTGPVDGGTARAGSKPGAITSVSFVADDAVRWVKEQYHSPALVIVNPPRRGLGLDLAEWLERSRARAVVYSSCNVTSLAKDLGAMPSLRVTAARVFDMFPQSSHFETMVLLERSEAVA